MDSFLTTVEEKISKKLKNPDFNLDTRQESEFLFSNKQTMFEQYKLLIDSAHKTEERRSSSNSIFLSINTLLASFLVRPSQVANLGERDLPLLAVLVVVGVFISWDWVKVTESYKKLNSVNYLIIHACEKLLPLSIFSLRAEIETETETEKSEKKRSNRANIILNKENLLPKTFLCFYIVYFLTAVSYLDFF